MLTIPLGAAAWLLACGAASSTLDRLTLALLTAYATRLALKPSTPSESAHRLAVLRTLLHNH